MTDTYEEVPILLFGSEEEQGKAKRTLIENGMLSWTTRSSFPERIEFGSDYALKKAKRILDAYDIKYEEGTTVVTTARGSYVKADDPLSSETAWTEEDNTCSDCGGNCGCGNMARKRKDPIMDHVPDGELKEREETPFGRQLGGDMKTKRGSYVKKGEPEEMFQTGGAVDIQCGAGACQWNSGQVTESGTCTNRAITLMVVGTAQENIPELRCSEYNVGTEG